MNGLQVGKDVSKSLSIGRREKGNKKAEDACQQEQGTFNFRNNYQVMNV